MDIRVKRLGDKKEKNKPTIDHKRKVRIIGKNQTARYIDKLGHSGFFWSKKKVGPRSFIVSFWK